MLGHCDYQLFLVQYNGEDVGRVSAFVDRLAVKHWNEKTGLFGAYECIDDFKASHLLLTTAKDWLHERGMAFMRGPWSFASEEWGTLIQGYESPPMLMSPYNPPFYKAQLEEFGLNKVKDLLVYGMERAGRALPERFLRLTDQIVEKYRVTVHALNMKRLDEDVRIILDIANASTRDNWGYVPVTEAEARDITRSMKMIVDPETVMIAEAAGKSIGYLIAFPDMNVLLRGLNGRLFPFGIFKLLAGRGRIKQYRVWGMGIIPEFQRRAIDTLFYRRLQDVLQKKNVERLEANYVLEDNMVMNNPIVKMGFEVTKVFRVYEMPLTDGQ